MKYLLFQNFFYTAARRYYLILYALLMKNFHTDRDNFESPFVKNVAASINIKQMIYVLSEGRVKFCIIALMSDKCVSNY